MLEIALLAGVLALGTALGSLWRRNNGRLRPVAPVTPAARVPVSPVGPNPVQGSSDPSPTSTAGKGEVNDTADQAVLHAADLNAELGERATLVQFSSAFCAPCRATRVVLNDIATRVPGIRHVEIDAESRLDLVRRFGVLKTPTVLVLDAEGRIVVRAAGAPRRADVLRVLEQPALQARH